MAINYNMLYVYYIHQQMYVLFHLMDVYMFNLCTSLLYILLYIIVITTCKTYL